MISIVIETSQYLKNIKAKTTRKTFGTNPQLVPTKRIDPRSLKNRTKRYLKKYTGDTRT